VVIDRAALLATLRDDAAGLLEAARRADPDARVPCCPAWSTSDLVWHIGNVHDFWAGVVRDGARPTPGRHVRPDDHGALLAFAAGGAAELQRVLAEADPAAPSWNWTGEDQTVAWVVRRMAHETAVHRVDAERAAGGDHRIRADIAADGIDEYLASHLAARRVDGDGAPLPLAGSVHLHCTDADGEWTITPDDGGFSIARDHAKADAALRGDANDLLLVLWRRLPLDAVTVFGDSGLADDFVTDTSS
jgi:uncharacterized protein (TIGR03083 family)